MIKRTKSAMRLCTVLLILNIAFIFGNSLLPGSVSAAISGWVKDTLAGILRQTPSTPESGQGILRKLAHFTEFSCLGLCLGWLFSMLRKKPWIALLWGFLIACMDETIQCFVPDRGPSFKDVMIDTSGVILGVLMLLLGYKIRKSKTKLEEIQK